MRKLKKGISLLCAASVALGMVSGCGKGGDGDMKKATIWMSVGHSKQWWVEKVQEWNETKAKEVGVELVFDAKVDDSYNQQIQIARQSGDLPEFYFDGACGAYDETGLGYPLNELPGMEDFLAPYMDKLTERAHKIGDKVYCIPDSSTTRGLIYNKDMFVAAGLVDENGEAKPPQTFDEVREYAKILTDTSKNQYGIIFPLKWASWVESDIRTVGLASNGYEDYNPVTGEYDYSGYESIINMIMGIKEDGSFYPGAEGLDNDPARAKFAEGNIGMKISYSFDAGVLNEQFPAKMDWGVAPLPVEDTENCCKQMSLTGSSLQVSRAGVEKLGGEVIAEIYKFLYSDEALKEKYIRGLEIPTNGEVIEGVELGDDAPKGWAEFTQMASISIPSPRQMPTDTKNARSFATIVLEDIWTGKVTDIKAALAEITDTMNAGIEAYKESHADNDIDYDSYIDANWNEKVRRDAF